MYPRAGVYLRLRIFHCLVAEKGWDLSRYFLVMVGLGSLVSVGSEKGELGSI